MRYSKGNLEFRNFIDLDQDALLSILEWRNMEEVRSMMRNQHIISKEEHLKFVNSLIFSKETSFYFQVYRKDRPMAVVYVHLKDNIKNKQVAEWGYYLSPSYLGSGFGMEVGFEAIHMCFDIWKLDALYGYVKQNNNQNLELQNVFSFSKTGNIENGELIEFIITHNVYKQLPETFKEFKQILIRRK